MQLYILRHGDAPFDSVSGERVLSSPGRSETAQVVQNRSDEIRNIPLIICSPVRRARETLAVVQETLSPTAEVLFDDCLRSESSIAAVEQYLDQIQQDNILLISHQPLVGTMLNYLTDQSHLGYSMGTSCLACLDLITFSRGCGTLNWLDCPQ